MRMGTSISLGLEQLCDLGDAYFKKTLRKQGKANGASLWDKIPEVKGFLGKL